MTVCRLITGSRRRPWWINSFPRPHVLITTYECARLYRHLLLHREWGYAVLDEGHKIRNPDAAITLTCKQLLSTHRLILTGAPIQNNLVELWSLFDFIFPGKLGTLPVFEDEFCGPIQQGGYTNASTTQVQAAYRCASVLRDLINPYVLRRQKADVAAHLPKKTEQVLFVNLSPAQREIYKEFLASEAVQETIDGRGSLFKAIHILRKITNHPDLLELKEAVGAMGQRKVSAKKVEPRDMPDYGAIERSGKLQVVEQIVQVWHKEGPPRPPLHSDPSDVGHHRKVHRTPLLLPPPLTASPPSDPAFLSSTRSTQIPPSSSSCSPPKREVWG